ncbi:MAG TPA: hypothetical protein VM121_04395 [Acidimicrobiales bacterium]|nr:hypothetical protein [Acidimicrobiales bacterium]
MVVLVVMMGAVVAMLALPFYLYGPNVSLLACNLALFVGLGICLWIGKRRPLGTPVTWGEAFVASTFVFALMMLAYGVIPHQWLEYADKDLLWRKDKFALGFSPPFGFKFGHLSDTVSGEGRILVSFEAVRDMIAAGFYIVFLGGQIALWSTWQKRGRKQPELDVSSAFGRPVVKAKA